ncbi:MAG: STAS domain-containing protein [Armatimonadetes bacterium]|nr:STAS domain-containing protein [Armatimonadota bacterium]
MTVPFSVTRLHGLAKITLAGDFDCYNAPKIRERLFILVGSGDADLLLCLSAVEYVDSVALATLFAVHQRTLAHGGSLRVICTNRQIWRAFEITGLHRAFPVYHDEITLIASLDAK